jgi:hypothetical protein
MHAPDEPHRRDRIVAIAMARNEATLRVKAIAGSGAPLAR